jgi:hypothetical protein
MPPLDAPGIPDDIGTSQQKRFALMAGSETYGFAMSVPPLRSGFHQGTFLALWEDALGDSFVVG